MSAHSSSPVSIRLDEFEFSKIAARLFAQVRARHAFDLTEVQSRTATAKALNFESPAELSAFIESAPPEHGNSASIVLDEKRFSNAAKRLAEHLSGLKGSSVGHVHARTTLAIALGFQSVNALQAQLKGSVAAGDSKHPVVHGAALTDAGAAQEKKPVKNPLYTHASERLSNTIAEMSDDEIFAVSDRGAIFFSYDDGQNWDYRLGDPEDGVTLERLPDLHVGVDADQSLVRCADDLLYWDTFDESRFVMDGNELMPASGVRPAAEDQAFLIQARESLVDLFIGGGELEAAIDRALEEREIRAT